MPQDAVDDGGLLDERHQAQGARHSWFGIQAWIGGEALQTMFKTVIPGWPQRTRSASGAARQVPHDPRVPPVFVPSLTAMIGYWATLWLLVQYAGARLVG